MLGIFVNFICHSAKRAAEEEYIFADRIVQLSREANFSPALRALAE